MNSAHASQQELLLRLQEKARKLAKLEEACRKQERVIERLEKLVNKLRGQQPKNGLLRRRYVVSYKPE